MGYSGVGIVESGGQKKELCVRYFFLWLKTNVQGLGLPLWCVVSGVAQLSLLEGCVR